MTAKNKPAHCKRCLHLEPRQCLVDRLHAFAVQAGAEVQPALEPGELCECPCHTRTAPR